MEKVGKPLLIQWEIFADSQGPVLSCFFPLFNNAEDFKLEIC